MKHFILSLSVLLASMGSAITVQADPLARFDCIAGDITYTVSINPFLSSVAKVKVSVGEQMDPRLNRDMALNKTTATPPDIFAYSGVDEFDGQLTFSTDTHQNVKLSFSSGHNINCENIEAFGESLSSETDDINGMTEMQARIDADLERNRLAAQRTHVGVLGISLGGKFRAGPGKEYEKIAKIEKNRNLIIKTRTGLIEKGFPWFEVKLPDGRTGFMRGSNLCSASQKVEGVYERCRGEIGGDFDSHGTAGLAGSKYDWMAFAIDKRGNVGHGVHPTRSMATTFAIKNCGTSCRIVDEAQAKCHSLYHSQEEGYWYGVAFHENGAFAMNKAKKYCKKGAPGKCKHVHSFCQKDY